MANERKRPSRSKSMSATKAARAAKSTRQPRKAAKSTKSARAAKPVRANAPAAAGAPVRRTPRADRAPASQRAGEIYARLAAAYPDARCALDFRTPFELLVATILSAQCTDKRVNMVTPTLFAEYPTPDAMAGAPQERLEELIRTTGFFRNKAKSLLGMSAALVEQHRGAVPSEMDALVELPGVGRKTANVILGNAFDRNEGVVVDTHVARVSQRLRLTERTDPVKIEQDLVQLFPRAQWTMLAHLLIEHGRQICEARTPKCSSCPVNELCPSAGIGV